MADLIEALQNLARERSRGGPSPLLALRQFAARPGARISHLGISQRLSQAWVTVTGEPFRPHQSLALSALRRGEPLALMGGRSARQTLHLLGMELLRAEAPATALLIAPDAAAAAAHKAELERLVQALGEPFRIGLAQGDDLRAAMSAQLLVATPEALHERLLRHHARAWPALWRRLRLLMVADMQAYDGLAAPHLAWLLRRAMRLASGDQPAQLVASVAPVGGAEAALAQLTGSPWRVIPADDGPADPSSLALWRPTGERARELVALALGLVRAGASVHITCAAFEAPLLHALVGADVAAVTVGPTPLPAQAQLLAGIAVAPANLRHCLEGARLTVLLLGDDPAERTLARLAAREHDELPGIDGPPPAWAVAPGNAYVAAAHLVCAAAEEPLRVAEVEAWGVGSVLARLEEHRQVARLPDAAWQPLPDGGDPYAGFDLRSAGSAPARMSDDQGGRLGLLDIAAFDRWGFVGSALPPLRGGFRVITRDDTTLELRVRSSPEPRRTLPLRRCTVRVRDRREQRSLRGREVGWGRVVLDEEVYGFREAAAGSAPAERVISPPISTTLAAPACWIDLPSGLNAGGQLAGWTLVAALPLRALSPVADLVPAYDAEARRIYFIDAQPGGNGVSAWLFTSLEELLPCAYDIALDCRGDPLLEPLARADTDWLLALLAGGRGAAERPAPPRPAAPALAAQPPLREPDRPAPPLRLEPVSRPEPPQRAEPVSRAEPPLAEPPLAQRHEPASRAEPPLASRPEPPLAEPPLAQRHEPASRAEPPLASRPEPPPPPRAEVPRREPPRPEPPPPPRAEAPRRESPRPEPPPPPRAEAPLTSRVEPPRPEPPSPPRAEVPRREPPRHEQKRRDSARRKEPPRPPPRREPPAAQPALPLADEPPARREPAAPVWHEPPAAQPAPPLADEPPARREPGGSVGPPRRPEPPPTPEAPLPDAGAMVARLRRLREQREREEPRPARPARISPDEGAEPRFHPGDSIVCTPYGRGVVRRSWVDGERELLLVAFVDHGELQIDAAVSAARLADDEAQPAEDDF